MSLRLLIHWIVYTNKMLAWALFGGGLSGAYLMSCAHGGLKYIRFKRDGFDGELSRATGKIQSSKPGIPTLEWSGGELVIQKKNQHLMTRCRVDRLVDEWKTRTIWVSSGKTMTPVFQTYLETETYPMYDLTTHVDRMTLKNLELRMNDGVKICNDDYGIKVLPGPAYNVLKSLGIDVGKEAKEYRVHQRTVSNQQSVTAVGVRNGSAMDVRFIGNSSMVNTKMRKQVYRVRYGRIFAAGTLFAGSVWLAFQKDDDFF